MEEKEYEIPPEGSLGLLAIGHIGLELWRAKKVQYETETGIKFQSFYLKEKSESDSAIENYLNTKHEEK